jgi:6-phosphofructokinase 2
LIKPNLGELSLLAGKYSLMLDEVSDVAKEIIEKGKCEVIVISMGAAGAMLVTKDNSETIAPPPVVVQSTVGAGDSMVAGIIYYLSLGKNITESFQYGVACGTAATTHPGTELCRKEEADRLYELIHKEKCM